MAITLNGLSSTDEVGESFYLSGWEWRPLRMICEQVMGDILPWTSGEAEMDADQVRILAVHLAGFLGDTNDAEFIHKLPMDDAQDVVFSITRERIEEFIAFLRACGGFESD